MSNEDFIDYNEDNWELGADCFIWADRDPFMAGAWIREDHEYRKKAEEICDTCPVLELCLQAALLEENDEGQRAEGLRGGFFFDSGKLPVSQARAVAKRFPDMKFGEWQSLGRPKQ